MVDPIGHRLRPEDQDHDQNHLEEHPGNRTPIDVRRLHRRRRDAAQVEQREAEWRMHETGLDVGADQHAEPDEVDAELVGGGRQQRNDDEGDLEKIEKERNHEHEDIHEDQEADRSPRQRRQHGLDPHLAAHALEHKAEGAGADQDIDHHGGDPHGGRHALIDERAGEGAIEGCEREGADGPHGAGLGRGGETQEDRAEHEKDQAERRNDATHAFSQQRPSG